MGIRNKKRQVRRRLDSKTIDAQFVHEVQHGLNCSPFETEAGCIFRCESFDAALDVADSWRQRWQQVDPWAAEKFLYGLRDSLRFYDLPKRWWKRLRTNNFLERLIKTLRPRLDPMGCFHDEPAIEKAVFGQLLRWHKIRLTHNT